MYDSVQDAPVQMDSSGLNVEMKADRNATVNAPVLTGNIISGSININYSVNPAGNGAKKCFCKAFKKVANIRNLVSLMNIVCILFISAKSVNWVGSPVIIFSFLISVYYLLFKFPMCFFIDQQEFSETMGKHAVKRGAPAMIIIPL